MADTDWKAGLSNELVGLAGRLRSRALSLPETTEDLPWGHPAIKVRGKAFMFMGSDAGRLGVSLKLPQSHPFALELAYAQPTGYGLGRAGWVSFTLSDNEIPDEDRLVSWLDESYRAVAPKSVVKKLPAR